MITLTPGISSNRKLSALALNACKSKTTPSLSWSILNALRFVCIQINKPSFEIQMLSTSRHVRQLKTFCIKCKIDRHTPNSFFSFCLWANQSFCRGCCDTDGSAAARYHQIKCDRREAETSDRNNPLSACRLAPMGWGLFKTQAKRPLQWPFSGAAAWQRLLLSVLSLFVASLSTWEYSQGKK